MQKSIEKQGISLKSKGLISRKIVEARICNNTNGGINFISFSKPESRIPAHISSIFSTQRNTVLAKDGQCICLTEHFMGAASLMNLNNVDVYLSEDELPFGDGSAKLWLDFFKDNQLGSPITKAELELKDSLIVKDESTGRYIKAEPDDNFSVTYELDWQHPKIGKQNFTWSLGDTLEEIGSARTFSSEEENKILGLDGWIVGMTENDFSMPLLFDNEPARHKALDLVGDLYLSGINPLNIKMKITSHKGGHELNAKMAKKLSEYFAKQ